MQEFPAQEGFQYHWFTSFPENLLDIMEQNDIDYIFFDHDLGENMEVSQKLNALLYENPERFNKAFSYLEIVIHSMNPAGAGLIANKFESCIESQIRKIPINIMKQTLL